MSVFWEKTGCLCTARWEVLIIAQLLAEPSSENLMPYSMFFIAIKYQLWHCQILHQRSTEHLRIINEDDREWIHSNLNITEQL